MRLAEEHADKRTETHSCDCISRAEALDAILKKPAWHNSDGSYYHSSDIKDALEALPSAQPEQRWIPVSERLPDVGKEVLVCYDFKGHRFVLTGTLYGDGKFHGYDDEYLTPEGRLHRKAVAWQPLPEPWKAKD